MSIEVDWQIAGEESRWPDEPPPHLKPRLPLPRTRRAWLALAGFVFLMAIAVAIYLAWTYRARLDQVAAPVRHVARLEARAVAANDLVSFMALQDPDDPVWRTAQEKRFGRLERVGLPEFGWKATGVQPLLGAVSLEPGGARLDVTYQFSVTQPVPGGPTTITLRLPQYYKPTPSGWVRAMPGAEFWGRWSTQSGKQIMLSYFQRDAAVLDPLIPRLDAVIRRMCESLSCTQQPIHIIFEYSPDAPWRLFDFSYGFESGYVLRLPSPHLLGLPADMPSRDELYRAVGTRIVQAMVYEASGQRLNLYYLASQEIMRWELAQAGLAEPFINEAITRTLKTAPASARQPLSTISLRTRSSTIDTEPGKFYIYIAPDGQQYSRVPTIDAAPDEAMISLAFAFIEEHLGAGSVSRMIPAIGTSLTLGDAISKTLSVNPATLEPAWSKYLQEQASFAVVAQPALLPPVVAQPALLPPAGELALSCSTDNMGMFPIWCVRTDGTSLTQIISGGQDTWPMAWSPDGKQLAYLMRDHVTVMDVNSQQVTTTQVQGWPGWLPDGRVRVMSMDRRAYLVNLATGESITITGTDPTWSPGGREIAYVTQPESVVWVADTDGRNARQVAQGMAPTWSPDGKRLAFWGDLEQTGAHARTNVMAIQIVDVASGAIKTLARVDKLLPLAEDKSQTREMSNLAWSPDGTMLAAGVYRQNNESPGPPDQALVILDADTGAVRTRQYGLFNPFFVALARVWSPDSRYLVFMVAPDSPSEDEQGELGILDVRTGRSVMLPSIGLWDWSPDGKWLAAAQLKGGVLLATPDLSNARWLVEGMSCSSVAWRP